MESHGEIKSNSPIMLCYIMIYDVWVSQKSKNRRKKSGLQRPQQVNHITQQPDQIFFKQSVPDFVIVQMFANFYIKHKK